jgi:hypothetical protein
VKSKITYIHVIWKAPAAGQPVGYYDEICASQWSLRCMREFSDGTIHAFHKNSYNWRDVMPEAPIPTVDEINADPQFQARYITKKKFDALWVQHYGLNQFSMMEPMLDVLPEFRPQWDGFVIEWKDNPHNKSTAGLPHYLVLSTLAGFLVNQLEHKRTEKFANVFAVVEQWLTKGDKYVSNAAGAGLLEDLLNPVHYTLCQPDNFKPWFGAETLRVWERLKHP